MREIDRLTVDEQAVTAEHDSRFDSLSLPYRGNEITDTRQSVPSRKVVAKLEMANVEVKR